MTKGRWFSLGAVLVALTMVATALANIKTIAESEFVPATRGYIHHVAENLTFEQKQSYRRWIDLYQDKLFEVEVQEKSVPNRLPSDAELFEARKRTLRNQIKLLEQKAE